MKSAQDDDLHVRKERRKLEEIRNQLKIIQKEVKEKDRKIDELNFNIEKASKSYKDSIEILQDKISTLEIKKLNPRRKTAKKAPKILKRSPPKSSEYFQPLRMLRQKRNVKTQTWNDDFPSNENIFSETPCSPSLARAGRPGSKDLEMALKAHRCRKIQRKSDSNPTSFLHAFFSKL